MKIVPYLSFNGQCREAFEFYAKVLDGKIVAMFSHGDTPAASFVGPDMQDSIINAHLIAESAELMGADRPTKEAGETIGFCVAIQLDDETKGEAIFNAFSDGGTIIMPFEPTFWAKKFGMVTDRYGTPWMINCGIVG